MEPAEELTLARRDDGRWEVRRAGTTVSVHEHEAGAEAERMRLAEDDGAGPDDGGLGAYPDNVGS